MKKGMIHKFRPAGIILIFASVLLAGCGTAEPQSLIAAEVPFSGESVMGKIAGEEYRYFRYDSVEAALVDKEKISSDGKIIGDNEIIWEGSVHIYHIAKRIVIYVGDNLEAMAQIERIFGPQIAGDQIDEETRKEIKRLIKEMMQGE